MRRKHGCRMWGVVAVCLMAAGPAFAATISLSTSDDLSSLTPGQTVVIDVLLSDLPEPGSLLITLYEDDAYIGAVSVLVRSKPHYRVFVPMAGRD